MITSILGLQLLTAIVCEDAIDWTNGIESRCTTYGNAPVGAATLRKT
jgi:hypothetical protein